MRRAIEKHRHLADGSGSIGVIYLISGTTEELQHRDRRYTGRLFFCCCCGRRAGCTTMGTVTPDDVLTYQAPTEGELRDSGWPAPRSAPARAPDRPVPARISLLLINRDGFLSRARRLPVPADGQHVRRGVPGLQDPGCGDRQGTAAHRLSQRARASGCGCARHTCSCHTRQLRHSSLALPRSPGLL